MPTLLHKSVGLVKGVGFDTSRRIGSLMQAVKLYNMREVDELVFFDVSATSEGRDPDYDLIDEFADECFMPLTVGGGIRSLRQVAQVLRVGADKVAINTALVEVPDLVGQVSERYGAQCVVACIDARKVVGGRYEAFIRNGTTGTKLDPVELAQRSAEAGAGEILITSVERDGTLDGYDIELVKSISEGVQVPVIAAGGAGSYADMESALREGGASAVAASAMFQFTHQTPLGAKRYLEARGFPVRRSTADLTAY